MPTIGRKCDEIRRDYRKHPVGSHVLFYRVLDDSVAVMRILHRQMDFDRYLP